MLVNDPDADRLCACVPDQAGTFRPLDGNQIGVLLADFPLAHAGPPVQVVSTVVFSSMLDTVARGYGAPIERTLTGFQWITSAGLELERRRAARFLFGYRDRAEAEDLCRPVFRARTAQTIEPQETRALAQAQETGKALLTCLGLDA